MSMKKYYGFLMPGNAFLETWPVYPTLLGWNEKKKRDIVQLFFFLVKKTHQSDHSSRLQDSKLWINFYMKRFCT